MGKRLIIYLLHQTAESISQENIKWVAATIDPFDLQSSTEDEAGLTI